MKIAQRVRDAITYRYRLARQHLEPLRVLTGNGRADMRQLASWRNEYAGRRCFIIGNGPSLRRTDVRLLKDEITIGSNALFLLFEESEFRPSFLTVEDPLVAQDRARELNALKGIQKLFPLDLSRFLVRDEYTTYIRFVRLYSEFPKFSDHLDRVTYWGGTVTYLNLQLAHHLGCNPIYLIGCDHSYVVPSNLNSHVITSQADDVNHFHPSYFGKGYRWHDPRVDRMEAAYRHAREYLALRGVNVFNATDGGALEVFDRVRFDSLFGRSSGQ